MIPIVNAVEALFLLAKHAVSTLDAETIEDSYIHDWARWTIEETRDSRIEQFLQTPLHLNFFGNFLDVSRYEEIYGQGVAHSVLESEQTHGKKA